MNHKTAIRWQLILLFGGFAIGMLGASLTNYYLVLAGFLLMCLCVVVWWKYYRCPVCHAHLGRGLPRRCPSCGAWLGSEPEPTPEKKKIQHKKKRH